MATVSVDDFPGSSKKRCCRVRCRGPRRAEGRSSLLSLTFEEIGFDSLNFMEFCIAIAMDVGIELSVDEVSELKTPKAVDRASRPA